MINSTIKILGLIGLAVLCVACPQKNNIEDSIQHGDYYIINNRSVKLIASAIDSYTNKEVELISNEIAPGSKVLVFTLTEGIGGHLMPSNAWKEFYVYEDVKSDSTIIYSGLEDKDWKEEPGNGNGRHAFNLTID
ncbi:MAG: hypothetical protein ACPGD5_11065 [Salibacteraceae bacterium]